MNPQSREFTPDTSRPLDTDRRHINDNRISSESIRSTIDSEEDFMDIFPCRHHRDEDINGLSKFSFSHTIDCTKLDEFTSALWSTIPGRESASFCENVFRHGNPHEPETDESDKHREKLGKKKIECEEKDGSIDNILSYFISHLDNMLRSEVSSQIHTDEKWNDVFYMNQSCLNDRIESSEGEYNTSNSSECFILEHLNM